MKKVLSLLLVLLMVLFAFAACDTEETNDNKDTDSKLKLGLGVYSAYEDATDATDDVNGKGAYVTTAAAVLLDKDGKVVKCEIDAAQVEGEFTAEGKFVSKTEFKTKGELKEAYGMSAAGKTEWYKQIDAFESKVIGKKASEIASLMGSDYKGSADVQSAGCTIYVSDFVKAVDAAIKNAKDSTATAKDTLSLAIATKLSGTDVTDDAAGALEFETGIAAVALDSAKKITACANDCVVATFNFDADGKLSTEYTGELKSKATLKEAYGMSNAGKTEWYKQAAAFDAACVGKTSAEIAGLMGADYKGVADVQSAGCTIYVSGMVQVIAKAAK